MNTSGLGFNEETFSNISDIISQNDIQILDRKLDIFDIVSIYLEGNQSEDPFFLVNVGDIIKQYEKWIHHFPNIKPYYAVKCNPDPLILKVLHRLGCGFDCATKNEILKILDLGASASDIIFANPCKMSNMIKYARAHDIDLQTFDSEHELYKLKLHHSNAKLIVRIAISGLDENKKFNAKYGADLVEVESLLKLAKNLKLNICGVAFHADYSEYTSTKIFSDGISDSKKVFEIGKKYGYNFDMLDIGGGFPGSDMSSKVKFEDIATEINKSLEEHFKDMPDLKIIAEPGRYFVARSHTLVTSVINKKYKVDPETNETEIVYYLNDGTYSSYFNVPMDKFLVNENVMFPFNERNEKKYKCTIFGPTCDSFDKLADKFMMPDLEIGEYMITADMGAYTLAVNTGNEAFNGFNRTQVKYFIN